MLSCSASLPGVSVSRQVPGVRRRRRRLRGRPRCAESRLPSARHERPRTAQRVPFFRLNCSALFLWPSGFMLCILRSRGGFGKRGSVAVQALPAVVFFENTLMEKLSTLSFPLFPSSFAPKSRSCKFLPYSLGVESFLKTRICRIWSQIPLPRSPSPPARYWHVCLASPCRSCGRCHKVPQQWRKTGEEV